MRKVFTVALYVFSVIFCALLLVIYLHRAPNKVIAEWKQPTSLDYQSFGPYYLSVVHDGYDYSSLPFERRKNYSIHVGRESGTPAYGHYLKYSFHASSQDEQSHIKSSSVGWNADGVTFMEASGHRLFIPKHMFIGGR